MLEGQYMLYAEEYCAPFMNKREYKKADILALAVDEQKQQYHSYLFDVKKDVGGDEVIFHLISQWKGSLLHLSTLLNYLSGYAGKQTIGVITRQVNWARIKKSIADKKQDLKQMENGPDTIAKAKLVSLLFEKRQTIQVLEKFTGGYFEADGRNYPYIVYILEPQGESFNFDLVVSVHVAAGGSGT